MAWVTASAHTGVDGLNVCAHRVPGVVAPRLSPLLKDRPVELTWQEPLKVVNLLRMETGDHETSRSLNHVKPLAR